MITITVERGLVRLKSWEDLYETPGFTRDLDPKTVHLKEIIGVYAFDSRQPCGLKSCRQPHSNGYLVTTTAGQVTNLGSVCGKNNFSVTFTNLQKAFDRDFRAKERRERLEVLKSRLPDVITRIDTIKARAGQFYTPIRHLGGDSGSMPRVVVDAIRGMRRSGDGAISRTRKATKQEQELALETGNARPGTPYYLTETAGRLSGVGAISASSALRTTFQELEPALRKLQSQDVESLSDKDARHLDKVTGGLDSRIEQLQQTVDLLGTFASRENLSQLESLIESASDRKLFSIFLESLPSG
ncbi:hypothetical protein [Thermomonas sp.]|uniref:hypothetical protein n=1 Tax=Thermomonas sp. TaxID=1971895 RepID=UPI0035B13BCC